MLKGKNIVLGVTGGIAVYKSVEIVSRLKKLGANVDVIMTEGAMAFVNPLTFQTMSANVVHKSMFNEITSYDVEHISLAKKADIMVLAPATANTIGKIANGIADNLLTTVIMATKAKVLVAPAMNTQMYRNPMVKENIQKLKNIGYEFIEPGVGLLACGDFGEGKMSEPIDIVEYIVESLVGEQDFTGIKMVITAGPTVEPLDPVRYMTNHSSGKMGYNIAEEAIKRGADVTLITGPTSLTPPTGANVVKVKTTIDMLNAVGEYFDNCHVLIKSAAPADYRPESISPVKIKKQENEKDEMIVKYVKNPDIAAHFGKKKKNQIMVGFAAETNNLEAYAMEKIKKKNLDFIVANDVTKEGAGFNVDTNIVTIIGSDGSKTDYPMMNKREVAKIILDKVKYTIEHKS